MNANNHNANRNQTIFFFQPRNGYIDINGEMSRWLHHDKGLFDLVFVSNYKGAYFSVVTNSRFS